MSTEAEALGERIAEMAAHLDAATHRLLTDLRDYDRSANWSTQGFRSCHDWLSYRVGWSSGTARDHLRVANRLGDLPLIDDALRRGEVSYSKVRAMTRVATPANEAMLLEDARHATGQQLELICRKYATVVRAAKEVDADHDRERRTVSRRDLDDGMVRIEATLHPEEAAVVWAALDRLARERSAAGSPAAAGTTVTAQDSSARDEVGAVAKARVRFSRADALIDMAQAVVRGDSPRRSPIELVVTVAADVLHGCARVAGVSAETRMPPNAALAARSTAAKAATATGAMEAERTEISAETHSASTVALVAHGTGSRVAQVAGFAALGSGSTATVTEPMAAERAGGSAEAHAVPLTAFARHIGSKAALATTARAAERAGGSAETRGASVAALAAHGTGSKAAGATAMMDAERTGGSAETRGASVAALAAHGTGSKAAGATAMMDAARIGGFAETCASEAAFFEPTACAAMLHAPFAVFADGTCVSAETARRLACDCGIVHVTEDATGNALSVSRKTRSIPVAIARALLKRDQCCRFPGCGNRVYVEGHHIEHWANGGETALGNLVSLCGFHHRFVHEYGYSVVLDREQRPQFFDPRGCEVLDVPERPMPAGLGWPSVVTLNAELAIESTTNECLWDGDRPSYVDIIDALVRADALQ